MTPSIAAGQSSHQVISPTHGPARDGDPSPFEAFLGSLRNGLTLTDLALAPPAPSSPEPPVSQATEQASSSLDAKDSDAPTDSKPTQEPAAEAPSHPVQDAESSHSQAEAAPKDPPKRKDSAEQTDPAPAQTDQTCTPAPQPPPVNVQGPPHEPTKVDGPSLGSRSVKPSSSVGPAPALTENLKQPLQRSEPRTISATGTEPAATSSAPGTKNVDTLAAAPSSRTTSAETPAPSVPPEKVADSKDNPAAQAVEPTAGDPSDESASLQGDHTTPRTTVQQTATATIARSAPSILSLTAELRPASWVGPAPRQATAPAAVAAVAPDPAANAGSADPPQAPSPAEHKVRTAHAQLAARSQPEPDQPPPTAEIQPPAERTPETAPQPHPDSAPASAATNTAAQAHQPNTSAPNAEPSGVQPAEAVAQVLPQTPARATTAPSPPNGAAARPITTIAGASTPISSKEALGKLSGQAPVLRRAVEQQSIVLQTARGLSAALKNGDGTVTLSLQPPRLGQLKVHLTVSDGLIQARMEPSSQAARQLLIDSEPSLRAALEARGLSVERIDVDAVKPSPHAHDAAPRQDSQSAADHGRQPDTPGGDSAGPGHQGRWGSHAGSGAEAHAGSAERTDAPDAEPALGSAAVTYALEGGGTYRLRLDALA